MVTCSQVHVTAATQTSPVSISRLAAISGFRASSLNLSMNPYTKHRLCRHSGILLGLSHSILPMMIAIVTHEKGACSYNFKARCCLTSPHENVSCQIIMIFNRSGLHVPITHDPALYHLFQEEQGPRIGYMLFTTCGPAPSFSQNY